MLIYFYYSKNHINGVLGFDGKVMIETITKVQVGLDLLYDFFLRKKIAFENKD